MLDFPDDPSLLKFGEHGVDSALICVTKVFKQLGMGLDVVGGLAEVGDEIQDIDFLHGCLGFMLIRNKPRMVSGGE